MTRLFISYRRADADSDAGRIADRLAEEFGDDNVFHDHEALLAGVPWQQQIDEALAQTDVTLVIIGPGWLDARDADGARRLAQDQDMVAYEIARSIERQIRIVPVLVRDAALPEAQALPEQLRKLPGYQGRRVRNDTFGADMNALVASLVGRSRRAGRRMALAGGAVAAVVLAAGAAWWLAPPRSGPAADGPRQAGAGGGTGAVSTATVASAPVAAPPEARVGQLGLRIRLRADAGETAGEADAEREGFLMSVVEPIPLGKILLPAPREIEPGVLEVVSQQALLPVRGERYSADVRRQPLSAFLDGTASHGRTSVCLLRNQATPPDPLRVSLTCDEGERCGRATDDPGHFRLCGQQAQGADWPVWPWLSTAHAQPTGGGTADPAWVIPSIETLKRQHAAGTGPAFTEVTLSSPPVPDLAAATRVSVQVTVNDREALIDGFEPDASAVPFDARTGVRLSFGLENLDFAGARQGHEDIALRLRFLDTRGTLVREAPAALRYIALRDHPGPTPVGDAALGLRWSASYFVARAQDRYQIFVASSENVRALVDAKKRLDAAGLTVRVDGRTAPLVGVVRPPLDSNRSWGLNVGLLQPSGQVRFTFDDAVSSALCRQVFALAPSTRELRDDSYRRSVDGTGRVRWCRQF